MPADTPAMHNGRSSGSVQSVHRALSLLEHVAEAGELGLVEAARLCELKPSTARRLLATLIECGYVRQQFGSSRYLPSFKLLHLAERVGSPVEHLKTLARPHLEAIRRRTDETTNLVLIEGRTSVYLDQVESSRPIRTFTEIGHRAPAHATAAGKAILAFTDSQAVAELVGETLPQLTARSISTGDELRAELARTRRRGFALDDEENELGVMCVGAPVFGHAGEPVAAISVSGPAARIRPTLGDLSALLRDQALELSRELGGEAAGALAQPS